MKRHLRVRFWVEAALAVISPACLALTLAWPQWIEGIIGLEPDGGDGSAEWGWTFALGAATVVCIAAARRTWKRAGVESI
jgi:hypothetical protein